MHTCHLARAMHSQVTYIFLFPPEVLFTYFYIKTELNTCLFPRNMTSVSNLKTSHLISDLIKRRYFLQNKRCFQ